MRAMKAGAVEFLPKPFNDRELLQAIDAAIARDRTAREHTLQLAELQMHYKILTPREREVLPFVVAGCAKQGDCRRELGTSEITIGVHRGQVMRKMGARSLAELIRMADTLGIPRMPDLSQSRPA